MIADDCFDSQSAFPPCTPQGSVLSATLFRLHIHFLPKVCADDLVLVIKGSIEKKLSQNIDDIEKQAKITMKLLEKFSKDLSLSVNAKKSKNDVNS
jgi:hypothetical protein